MNLGCIPKPHWFVDLLNATDWTLFKYWKDFDCLDAIDISLPKNVSVQRKRPCKILVLPKEKLLSLSIDSFLTNYDSITNLKL